MMNKYKENLQSGLYSEEIKYEINHIVFPI